ncbi:carboxymuconolactone decarboxylase family protein [Planctomycetales bacterium ZRK34]|nr:carboxymuconolactone decarboxylase family protein [Planctomycetales bacterium ZRK34]
MADDKTPSGGKLPKTFQQFTERFPELAAAHQQIGQTVDQIGPLDDKTRCLIKIGICVGGGLESALRSHVRRATQAGATREEIEQAIMLGMNTVGFPRTVAAWSWAKQQFLRDDHNASSGDGD